MKCSWLLDEEVVMVLEFPLVTGVSVLSSHWKVAELPFTEQFRMKFSPAVVEPEVVMVTDNKKSIAP